MWILRSKSLDALKIHRMCFWATDDVWRVQTSFLHLRGKTKDWLFRRDCQTVFQVCEWPTSTTVPEVVKVDVAFQTLPSHFCQRASTWIASDVQYVPFLWIAGKPLMRMGEWDEIAYKSFSEKGHCRIKLRCCWGWIQKFGPRLRALTPMVGGSWCWIANTVKSTCLFYHPSTY